MRITLPPNSPIDMQRFRKWLSDFSGYRHIITQRRIELWIDQFRIQHQDLAARVLDCVDFIGHSQISTAYRELLSGIDGWSADPARRRGKWRFVSFSASSGESGDEMIHKFRRANNLSLRRYNELFIYKSELVREQLGVQDTVVFVDDFSGSGKQICDTWKEVLQEILPDGPRIFLLLVVASSSAIKQIEQDTDLVCCPYITLNENDNIFSNQCIQFSIEDKSDLLKYCKRADKKYSKGFGECGFVLVFTHSCPNNTIPILHKCHRRWEGLFP